MPARLGALTRQESEVTLYYLDEPLTLTINRQAVTTKFLRELAKTREDVKKRLGKEATEEQIDTEDSYESGFRQIERLVIKWDVVDEQNKPVPCNREVLEGLPLELLQAILTAIWETIRPNEPKSESSFG